MEKSRCYTPQLRREVVSRLYHRAKSERVPMTVLANRLMESALNDPKTTAPTTTKQLHQRTAS